MEDRRIFERINIKAPFKFVFIADHDKEYEALIVDISGNGIGFIAKEKLSVNATLELRLLVGENQRPVRIFGEVVWVQILPYTYQHRVGVYVENNNFLGLAHLLQRKAIPN